MPKKVGIKDIATKAGVSIGTVDRVLHNRGEVKKETLEKVMKIVKELGYRPNILAKSLSSKKTSRIVIVIPNSSDINPYWEKPISGINKAKEELSKYNFEIIYKTFDGFSKQSFKEALEETCKKMPDGIVFNPIFYDISLDYIKVFKQNDVPFVFIDANIKGVGKLAYFGQDAENSGKVAARLMKTSTPKNPKILVVKQSDNKVFSQHIDSRVQGFVNFFESLPKKEQAQIRIVEIDLQKAKEPGKSLNDIFKKHNDFKGVFVPNSRVFFVADFIKENNYQNIITIGYDLVDKNARHLKQGTIDYLICQKPEDQAYGSIVTLFNYLMQSKDVEKKNYSPIDIIIKENLKFYKEHNQTIH